MGCADAVGARVAATDDKHVFTFGCDSLVAREFSTCQHSVLLGKQFEGEVHALQ